MSDPILAQAMAVDSYRDKIRKAMYSRLEAEGVTLPHGWTNGTVEEEFIALYDRTKEPA